MMSEAATVAAVNLHGVVKYYDRRGRPAVDRIHLDIRRGEFLTLLGPSGSGKTTTLHLIAGFVAPDTGSIFIDDRNVDSWPAHKRNLGVVFQNYALFPHMTVGDNVAFPLKQRRIRKSEVVDRVRNALDRVGLAGYERRWPNQLSGGQQQRVAVARAIVYDPNVLLMDEPLGALDKSLREHLQSEISRLHRELGMTFIYVTHDQTEALALSDRIAVFNEGQIEQIGTPRELYERPANMFVANFVGESAILHGDLIDSETFARHDGTVVKVPAVPHRPECKAVALVMRPEHLRIVTPAYTPLGDENFLKGTITDSAYLGNSVRVLVEFSGGDRAIVRESAKSDVHLAIGNSVGVVWHPDDSTIVDDSG